MSLSEKDRAVLLQEIKQIESILGGSDRNFSSSGVNDIFVEDDLTDSNPETKEKIVSNAQDGFSNLPSNSDGCYEDSQTSQPSTNDPLILSPTNKSCQQLLEEDLGSPVHFKSFANMDNVKDCDSSLQKPVVGSSRNHGVMSNLYAERIFKGYRVKNFQSPSTSASLKDQDKALKSSASVSVIENLLQLNRTYQRKLDEEIYKVEHALNQNRQMQDDILKKDEEEGKKYVDGLSKANIGRFTKPYFKDRCSSGPPENEDAKELKSVVHRDFFALVPKQWKKSESKLLEDAVYNNNFEKKISPHLKRLKEIDKANRERVKKGLDKLDRSVRDRVLTKINDIKAIPRKEMLIDAADIDFMKISNTYLEERRDFECRLHWCNVMHPTINQSKFTKDEDSQLIKLARKFKNFEWEKIAITLGTNRTPVQCLQRFQRTLNKDLVKKNWHPDEDTRLREAIKLYGFDWVAVSEHVGERTGNQCLFRWRKSVNPLIKRGRWSSEEDKLLIAAVEKFGRKDWRLVKNMVPGRTDAQCRERYMASLDPDISFAKFTEEEDLEVIRLVEKYGPGKWALVASHLPHRRDSQIWRRYKILMSEEYHEYRKEVLWKKKSVLTYFLNRNHEKRDYDIKELDVNYSPSLNPSETRNLLYVKKQLLNEGLTEDEVAKKLAQMTFSGQLTSCSSSFRAVKLATDAETLADQRSFVESISQRIAAAENPVSELGIDQNEIHSNKKKSVAILKRKVVDENIKSAMKNCESILRKFQINGISYAEAKALVKPYVTELQMKCKDKNIARSMRRRFVNAQKHQVFIRKKMVTQDLLPVYRSVPEVINRVKKPDPPTPSSQHPSTDNIPVTDQLRTFTLLLAALHVDTTGVMKCLPQPTHCIMAPHHQIHVPQCYPISPNIPTLLGLRTLLLKRRSLSDRVNDYYADTTRDIAYKHTRSYDALKKRFVSLFLWPTFLATFSPKFPKEGGEVSLLHQHCSSDALTTRVPVFPNSSRKRKTISTSGIKTEDIDDIDEKCAIITKKYIMEGKHLNQFLSA